MGLLEMSVIGNNIALIISMSRRHLDIGRISMLQWKVDIELGS